MMIKRRKWIIAAIGGLIFTICLVSWLKSSKNENLVGISEGSPLPKGKTQPQLIILNEDAFMLAPDGALYLWGGKSTTSEFPQVIKPRLRFQCIAADQDAVVSILDDGTIWGWEAKRGVIPFDQNLADQEPRRLFPDIGFAKISMGKDHVLALKEDGTLWAWGKNRNGELGQGRLPRTETPTPKESNVPIQIGIENDWVSIHTSHYISYAIKQDGTILRWGKKTLPAWVPGKFTTIPPSAKFQIKQPHEFSRPERFTHIKGWKQVIPYSEMAFLLHEDGSLWIDGPPSKFRTWIPTLKFDANGLGKFGNVADWKYIAASENFILAQKKPDPGGELDITSSTQWESIWIKKTTYPDHLIYQIGHHCLNHLILGQLDWG